ncbi:hypothetical protein BDE40_0468 [Litoreibacter halocynthiae]|uniref:Uncharacterized protein n=1 Tax=Litoreibacter halocynthiae TaxID=1242689 RepID=A0A4R7LMF5_9RHOB|nr:hypothetical protein BDE40_0468 [Litoreibacter halocynthiae]
MLTNTGGAPNTHQIKEFWGFLAHTPLISKKLITRYTRRCDLQHVGATEKSPSNTLASNPTRLRDDARRFGRSASKSGRAALSRKPGVPRI